MGGTFVASVRASDGPIAVDSGPWTSSVVAAGGYQHLHIVGFGSTPSTQQATSPSAPGPTDRAAVLGIFLRVTPTRSGGVRSCTTTSQIRPAPGELPVTYGSERRAIEVGAASVYGPRLIRAQ